MNIFAYRLDISWDQSKASLLEKRELSTLPADKASSGLFSHCFSLPKKGPGPFSKETIIHEDEEVRPC